MTKHLWEAAEDRAGDAGDAYDRHIVLCARCGSHTVVDQCPTGRALWSAYAKLRTDADNMLTPTEESR